MNDIPQHQSHPKLSRLNVSEPWSLSASFSHLKMVVAMQIVSIVRRCRSGYNCRLALVFGTLAIENIFRRERHFDIDDNFLIFIDDKAS